MNITKETAQAAIDAVIEQGKQSHLDGSCVYRSDGACCAVGHMITEENYSEELEGKDAFDADVQLAVSKSLGIELTYDDERFLAELQSAHDDVNGVNFIEAFKEEAEGLINRYF